MNPQTKNRVAKSTTRSNFRLALLIQLVIGLFLTVTTIGVLGVVHDAGNNEVLQWLSLSSVGVGGGVGIFALLLVMFGVDALWIIYLVLWLLKRKLHIRRDDNTLRLP